ncbi:MAG TPA: hypothetical protein VGO50_17760 [Pyrinomonadaceae bacterium]|jgi:hypothetical protein|nr:hypothetical protein [Pyrinomonadaceae bacterium]
MLKKFSYIAAGFFIFIVSISAWPQKTAGPVSSIPAEEMAVIKSDSDKVSPGFIGHNIATLFNNLQAAAKDRNIKTVYGPLTTDDLFAFSDYAIAPADFVSALKTDGPTFYFRGSLWRLRPAGEFPEPRIEYVNPCYTADAAELKTVASREKLVTAVAVDPNKPVWKEAFFPIRTVLPDTDRKHFKGRNVGVRCRETFVPSPQFHYGLSFVKEQPFRLIKITGDNIFSLDTYSSTAIEGVGFAAWTGDDVVPPGSARRHISILFVVKLTPPYAGSKTFTMRDSVEKKDHIAIQNKVYADLVGVWLYDFATGEILSKTAIDPQP